MRALISSSISCFFVLFGTNISEGTPVNNDHSEIRSFISNFEGGARNKPYRDSRGFWTVGIGHKLTEADKRAAGGQIKPLYSTAEIEAFWQNDLSRAIQGAKNFCFPSRLDQMPQEIQALLIDMAFNLGEKGLMGFKRFRAALVEKGDFLGASKELRDSKWYGQTGRRVRAHVKALENMARLSKEIDR